MRIAVSSLLRPAGAIFLLALAACQVTPEGPRYPELRFTDVPPIRLDVASVDYVEEYVPPQKDPNVDHVFPVTLSSSVRNWTNDRIVAAGSAGVVRVVLVDASVIEVMLEKSTGLTGTFTTDQAERYEASVKVRLEIYDGAGKQVGKANIDARRSVTAAEGISLKERDDVWYGLTKTLMADIDRELELTIHRHLARFTI